MRMELRFGRSALALVLAAGLGGCAAGHGKYTREHIERSEQNLAVLKSGTEYQMAEQHFEGGELDKAIRAVDDSIAMNPEVSRSHLLRGRVLLEQGRIGEARESLARAAELDESSADPWYYIGIASERMASWDEALEAFTRASELDPSNPQFAVARAEMLVELDRLDDAERVLVEAQSRIENNAALRQSLGQVEMLRGRPAAAERQLTEALLLAPDDVMIMEDLARAQAAAGRLGESAQTLSRLLALPEAAGRRDLELLHARTLASMGRLPEARESLLALTSGEIGENDVEAWIELGLVSYRLGDGFRLRRSAEQVRRLAPDRADGFVLEGLAHWRGGRKEAALASLDRAATLDPRQADTLVLRGMIEQDLGRLDAARASYARALSLDPSSDRARALLRQAEVAGAGEGFAGVETE